MKIQFLILVATFCLVNSCRPWKASLDLRA